ncbi:MAG: hypothetical protein DME98_14250 [Verrucomicrobia bacterium]|nr:MAG: hypothetical protein DME98_14250 [Verrucomicrobiota bacterium]PYJ33972.1 MAG: hypothetical protein DME88_06645 [Verrucomicrobiota bacterium]
MGPTMPCAVPRRVRIADSSLTKADSFHHHNKALDLLAMRIGNENCSPARINGGMTADRR